MPVNPVLQNTLKRALGNEILSRGEAKRIIGEVRSAEDVAHVVEQIQAAYQADKLELTKFSRADNLNALLSELDRVAPLPLDRQAAQQAGGGMNWIAALGAAHNPDPAPVPPQPGPVDPDPVVPDPVVPNPAPPMDEAGIPAGPVGPPLAKKSFGGRPVGVNDAGGLAIGGRAIAVELKAAPNDDALEALQALARPGALAGLSDGAKAALTNNLIGEIEATFPVGNEAQGKFRQIVGAVAALGAIGELAESLTEPQIGRLIAQYEHGPNPLAKSIILRTLEEAPASAAQKRDIAGLEAPEAKGDLLAAFDELMSGQARTKGYNRIEGPAIGFALSAITFARTQGAVDNVYGGMDTWAGLNAGRGWDAEEIGHMAQVLETYVDSYPQTAYVFGTFNSDAPKEVAKLTNARVVAELAPKLEGAAPSFDGVPMTAAQADTMKGLLDGVADEGAVRDFTEALSEAADLMSPKLRGRWQRADKPREALTGAAFALFERVAKRFHEQKDGTDNGMIAASALKEAVRAEVGSIKEQLVPRLTELNGQPPKLGAATLSAEAASFVKGLLADHLRSEMSVDNVVEAVEVFAAHHGGRLEGEGLAGLKALVEDYKGNWPDLRVFDFNKLGRMARFAVEGKEVPLSTLNGQKIGLAEFYAEVAKGVAKSFDGDRLAYGWMADRWGRRAKESVEILDVIAQRTAEGAGPVAELQRRYPGSAVTVVATGSDGAHDQFVFDVKGKGRFVQSSEGELAAYRGRPEPELFRAHLRPDGSFDVKVPPEKSRSTDEWPVMTTYSVGDSIDLKYLDPDAVKRWEEGEPFSDEHKVLQGRIERFDGEGNYTVSYTKPNGDRAEKQLSLREIVDSNNPHHFSLKGSVFSDVRIDVDKDPELVKLLEGVRPIINQYLPRDGSLLELSPTQLFKRQRDAVDTLMDHIRGVMKYPASKDGPMDAESERYHEIIDGLNYWEQTDLGNLLEIGKGVCRHQCIVQQLVMQEAGIDSRLASGAANERDGDYRGLHIWLELSLADNGRYLSDQTWNDATIPLWDGAYDVDKRRVEMFHRTDRYRDQVV
jgi:hypothetical protein